PPPPRAHGHAGPRPALPRGPVRDAVRAEQLVGHGPDDPRLPRVRAKAPARGGDGDRGGRVDQAIPPRTAAGRGLPPASPPVRPALPRGSGGARGAPAARRARAAAPCPVPLLAGGVGRAHV